MLKQRRFHVDATQCSNIMCLLAILSARTKLREQKKHVQTKKSLIRLHLQSGPEVIKLFSYSTHLSMTFIMLINVKMPTIVGILTFISMIKTTSGRLKARNLFNCRYFSFYKQLKFSA